MINQLVISDTTIFWKFLAAKIPCPKNGTIIVHPPPSFPFPTCLCVSRLDASPRSLWNKIKVRSPVLERSVSQHSMPSCAEDLGVLFQNLRCPERSVTYKLIKMSSSGGGEEQGVGHESSSLRTYPKLPVWVVEDHHDVSQMPVSKWFRRSSLMRGVVKLGSSSKEFAGLVCY